ncbi:hypothetical protein CRUP_009697 [Coryphaenoides rupestris]|nr:hypothetical protein CRUP_009697 [Coryphaenoides rupestris]
MKETKIEEKGKHSAGNSQPASRQAGRQTGQHQANNPSQPTLLSPPGGEPHSAAHHGASPGPRRQIGDHNSSYCRRCMRWMMSRQSLKTRRMFSVSTAHVSRLTRE